jgi:hypothetical protein
VSGGRWSELIELLHTRNVIFLDGLTDTEVEAIEAKYGFRFPPDLRDFLQTGLPTASSFLNWRSATESDVRKSLAWPLEGMLFDVENNVFWLREWGAKPETADQRRLIVEQAVDRAPRLIPVYSHRYMPDRPHESGNPVLSVYQTDIIYYGFDLDDYLRHEFDLPDRKPWAEKGVEFWDDVGAERFRSLTRE